MMRYSLLATLSNKHKLRSVKKTLAKYGDLITAKGRKDKEVHFLSSVEITNKKKAFLTGPVLDPYKNLAKSYRSLQIAAISAYECAVKSCSKTDVEVHHTRKVYRGTSSKDKVVVKGRVKKLLGSLAFDSALKRK